MQEVFSIYNIISGVLVGTLIIFIYILRNLLIKVEKYEDEVVKLQDTLSTIQNTLADSKKHLNQLDERGVFESDDEVGYFFEQLKTVQNELDRLTNAQEEKQS
jgi:predicted  nucleic acid-binding Zn-ribbon protein|tara:strand:+ start:947 stop:1255 length:309 start_codon:yes stop_codon:yes gene_type:complete